MATKTKNMIACPLKTGAKRFEKAPAILARDTTISYIEMDAMVSGLVVQMKKEGILSGDRVAIVSWNSWEYVALLFAILRLGAVACPVSPRFPEKGLQSIVQKLGCTTLLYGETVKSGANIQISSSTTIEALFKRDQAHAPHNTRDAAEDLQVDPNRPATIVLTSGTTSDPKAVLHSFANHYYNALGANENIPIGPGHRWLLSLPLSHVGGLGILFRVVIGGGAIVIPPEKKPLGSVLEQYRITHLSLVTTQLYRLLEEDVHDSAFDTLQAVLVGGGPVPPVLVEKAGATGIPIHTTYGLTEMASQVTTTEPKAPPTHLATSGRALPHRKIMVTGDDILVKGKTLFQGYVERSKIVRPFDEEGWYRTGDRGQLDSHGYLTVLGRQDNMFISGGENMCPEEIERHLCAFPPVSLAVVVPVDNKEFGFRPVAFIQTFDNRPVERNPIIAHLEKHLPRFKIPDTFYPWPEDLKNGDLKPDRRSFVERAKAIRKRYR